MKKILVAPDSFKGTFSAKEVCDIIAKNLKNEFESYEIISAPLADGGEGSLDCVVSNLNSELITYECTDLFFNKIKAPIAFLCNDVAFIESASCIALKMQKNMQNPCISTSFGVGELILYAKDHGAKEIIISLGGSGTNDFGCGLACALGAKFYNEEGNGFIPVGETLSKVAKIDLSELKINLQGTKITALTDVDNPPYGKNGASYIYAPQKGATKKQCNMLDKGVKYICDLLMKDYNVNLSNLKGGGAAGAIGAGLFAFCNAEIKSGINYFLKISNFNSKIKSCDLVITGEGCTDNQSLNGKLISGVIDIANNNKVPIIILSGMVKDDLSNLYKKGVIKIYSTVENGLDFNQIKLNAKQRLTKCVKRLVTDIKNGNINL